jgi:hypothetical protein
MGVVRSSAKTEGSMQPTLLLFVAAAAVIRLGVLSVGVPGAEAAPGVPVTRATAPASLIPQSIQAEHEAIHTALVTATKQPGRVGKAAQALAEVLHPHFVREEEIALPPLGLLAPLAAGRPIERAGEVLAMSDALRKELPRMLDEHVRIRAAVAELRRVAEADRALEQVHLAEALAEHALTEEEVLYPAAVLVGDLLRARTAGR